LQKRLATGAGTTASASYIHCISLHCTSKHHSNIQNTCGPHQLHSKTCFVLVLHYYTPDQGVDLLCLDVIKAAYSLLDLFLVGSDVNNEDLHPDALTSKPDMSFVM